MPDAYRFDEAVKEWSRLPVDDFDYVSVAEMMSMTLVQRKQLLDWAWTMRRNRNSWRNRDGCLDRFMEEFPVEGKRVCDFGCGLGLDAAWFAIRGAEIVLADISPLSVAMANQVICTIAEVCAKQLVIVYEGAPWFFLREKVDLFWSLGCLHHTPNAGALLKRACEQLKLGGECRILVYSDRRWLRLMGEAIPGITEEVSRHPRFAEWVKKNDAVGNYADWYNEEKLQQLVKDFGEIKKCEYLSDGEFLAAVIQPMEWMHE